MSNCKICGRPLSNPGSVAAGIGPICGSRGYSNRIKAKFGSSLGGWSEIEEWEKVNNPCYSCKNFEFPPKGKEVNIPDGYQVKMHGQVKEFAKNCIGGFCKALKELVDGNVIKEECICKASLYHPRKKSHEQPSVGLLHGRDGQAELFEL